MRSFLLRSAVLMIVAAILGGHVTELFDHWDHTLRTGKDADYAVVLVGVCAGAAFVVAKSSRILRRLIRVIAKAVPLTFGIPAVHNPAVKTFAFDLSPPPASAPIRI